MKNKRQKDTVQAVKRMTKKTDSQLRCYWYSMHMLGNSVQWTISLNCFVIDTIAELTDADGCHNHRRYKFRQNFVQ